VVFGLGLYASVLIGTDPIVHHGVPSQASDVYIR
jgi:hypothetical protein